MAQVTFRCSSADRMLPNRCESFADGLTDAREQAEMVARALIATPGGEDWRAWVMHVSDDLGEEIMSLSFASLLGPLH